jgi:hypothetical protein
MGGTKTRVRPGWQAYWRSELGLQQLPLQMRCVLYLRICKSPGRSGWRSWLWTAASRTPKTSTWHGRDSTGARRYRGPPTLGRTARTPEALDEPPSHRLAGFVVR